ncbi:MAG: hypothetical protein MZV70_04960 [Desulfobacterales bacterium]|nr:hypothetical protein [Desulfobacterales bacterium]
MTEGAPRGLPIDNRNRQSSIVNRQSAHARRGHRRGYQYGAAARGGIGRAAPPTGPLLTAQEITRLGQGLLPCPRLQPEPIRRTAARAPALSRAGRVPGRGHRSSPSAPAPCARP